MATSNAKRAPLHLVQSALVDPFLKAQLEGSGLDSADAERNGIQVADQAEVDTFLRKNRLTKQIPLGTKAITLPSHDPDGTVAGYRLRFDIADKKRRYRGPSKANGGSVAVNFPVVPSVNWEEIKKNPKRRIAITEGEKKSLSGTKHLTGKGSINCPVIGLQGVWMFGSKKEDKALLDALEQIDFQGREVLLPFDSDASENPDVALALEKLSDALTSRGANVLIPILTPSPEGEKRGLDDYLAEGAAGRDELLACFEAAQPLEAVSRHPITDFLYDLPNDGVVHLPTGAIWTANVVNQIVRPVAGSGWKTMPPSVYLAKNNAIDGRLWWPGKPQIIEGKDLEEEGLAANLRMFNSYRPPAVLEGNARDAKPWVDHVKRLYPDDYEEIFNFCAHRVQFPGEKINHALVIGSEAQRIGKDTILSPLRVAVGPHNWSDIKPHQVHDEFKPWVQSVVLRINELRDQSTSRFDFYNMAKDLAADPPETLTFNDKHIKSYPIKNLLGLVATTNYEKTCIPLEPADDRFYIAWSHATRESLFGSEQAAEKYFIDLYAWLKAGGFGHVAAWLRKRDLSNFNPKAPPKKTPTWHAIVNFNRDPQDSALTSVIEHLRNPKDSQDPADWVNVDALTIGMISKAAQFMNLAEFAEDFRSHKSRRAAMHAWARAGYEAYACPGVASGLWRMGGNERSAIYCKKTLSDPEKLKAARALQKKSQEEGKNWETQKKAAGLPAAKF